MTRISLVGDVSSADPTGVRPVLAEVLQQATISATQDGWHVEGVLDAEDARDANRRLLSAMRRVERRTRLRAEWTDGAFVYRFFDYVPKSKRPASAEGTPR